MSDDLKFSPHFVKARAQAADLLADIDAFEELQCHFGVIANGLIRAKLKDPYAEEFELRGTVFRAVGLRERLLILSHVAKPHPHNLDIATVRPFGELLVEHGITEARLISPNTWTAWVEVRGVTGGWRKLRATEKAPEQPSPTTVIDAEIPPAPDGALEAQHDDRD